jgi:hypothetical protein
MSHNKSDLMLKRCRGIIIPQYKNSRQLRKNPLWGKPNQEEFETLNVCIEINSVCIDCKRVECKEDDIHKG